MYLPTALADELKLYLEQLADKGETQAQTLLTQIEQVATPSSTLTTLTDMEQEMSSTPPEGMGLRC
ncbi:hypothetical protein H6F50_24550 [Coleofasciculus sp. FACHB-712]|uniref:hypothetical protein n=1 Tax=Cyanophyceae TaxID=3028117 RepID=UPI001682B072|nr:MULTISPECIES: hypothetical protein [unclassified Coleofasciculus]MBD1889819.1 hypothetical protein [Coleofasciculus sp. FACHB-SPT9]MBD1945481.1 hypothetical protein [Coleofasciculus sp. FACHB-712]